MDLQSLIDAFLASYRGRDPSLLTRLALCRERLGEQPIASVDADIVFTQVCALSAREALKYLRGRGKQHDVYRAPGAV